MTDNRATKQLLASLIFLSVVFPTALSSARAVPEDKPDPVSTLDEYFRDCYAADIKYIRDHLGPVIIATGRDVILIENGKHVASKNYIPREYTVTKTVDHIVLAAFLILKDHLNQPLDSATRKKLEQLKTLVDKSESEVQHSALPSPSPERQKELIAKSVAFLNAALSAGHVTSEELDRLLSERGSAILANVDEAVSVELKELDQAIQAWRAKMTEAQWKQTYFVVAGEHMPREQRSEMQYFLALTKEEKEGNHVIYFENDNDYSEDKAFNLLAKHILDRAIAVGFFHEPWRMHRDLLSDGAAKYLHEHPPAN